MEHTKGKWEIFEHPHLTRPSYDIVCGKKTIAAVFSEFVDSVAEAKANTKYIIDCVNAHDQLTAQRDELLAVCKLALKRLNTEMTTKQSIKLYDLLFEVIENASNI